MNIYEYLPTYLKCCIVINKSRHGYHTEQLIKNSYLFLLSRINVFIKKEQNTVLQPLHFYLILIYVVLSGVTVVLHWKINL